MSTRERFLEAAGLQRSGRVDIARDLYKSLLLDDPEDAGSLNNLATLECQQGNFEVAEELLLRAVKITPTNAIYHFNLAECYRAHGQFHAAIDCYQKCLKLGAVNATVYGALGQALLRLSDLKGACDAFRRSLSLRGGQVKVCRLLAKCLVERRELSAAEPIARSICEMEPGNAEDSLHLASILEGRGKSREAELFYRRAAESVNQQAAGLLGLSRVKLAIGGIGDAKEYAEQALQADPKCYGAHYHLGLIYHQEGRIIRALEEFRAETDINSKNMDAMLMQGAAHLELMEHGIGIKLITEAMNRSPGSAKVASSHAMALNYLPDICESAVFEAHAAWPSRVVQIDDSDTSLTSQFISVRDKALRIGYLSADLRKHPVAHFLEPILASHNHTKCVPVVLNDSRSYDDTTERLESLKSEWVNTRSVDDAELPRLIRSLGIDVLVDLMGHTAENRLRCLMKSPAPVQISYLGYPNTTGLPKSVMQFRITDDVCDPAGITDRYISEQLYRLPDCFLCYRSPIEAPRVAHRPVAQKGHITFGCFNVLLKLTLQQVHMWARILERVDNARLLVKARCFHDLEVRQHYMSMFSSVGISSNRVDFVGHEATAESHLAKYGYVDISLDTFPYCGTTTTCESLWMGVPVISLKGLAHRSRVGASILQALQLNDLVAENENEYVNHAVRLAMDPDWLHSLGGSLRQRMAHSPLMNEPRFVAGLERGYSTMYAAMRQQCAIASSQPS